ncbi:iron chaperone [Streptococcus henryi]|uniref:iron chaperone n=1 Tax=Streptococcus henryi TaxID=439219 RepID=UPI0003649C77|nr:DUF1801 domain-containing protein [Streptococcus henryi]
MWICPNCQREFKRKNQGHFCGEAPKTIDDYIQGQSHQEELQALRKAISQAIPEAEERIAWTMPTYWKGKNILHFAAKKQHIGFHIGQKAIAHFEEELADFPTSKGTVKLPYDKPLPLELIEGIAKWCLEEYGE